MNELSEEDLLKVYENLNRSLMGSGSLSIVVSEFDEVLNSKISKQLPELIHLEFEKKGLLWRAGRTAGQLWEAFHFPTLRSGPQWFGHRLARAGCQIENYRAELGNRSARLFDPDRAEAWINSGGRAVVHRYIAGRQGQLCFEGI